MKLLVILAFSVVVCQKAIGQSALANVDHTFLFCNAENLFDCENDLFTNDDEFTPDGDRRWTHGRLKAKTDRLAKVILAAGKWSPPVFIGLCEVENQRVLDLLTGRTVLSKYAYKIVHKDSPDVRGIDVAFIYRSDLFKPFDYQAIPVIDPTDQSFKTRDILRVSGVINDCDTLHVFVNHWPSRYGGTMETVYYRSLAATTLKNAIQNLNEYFPHAKVICVGDFNDTPTDESLWNVLGAKKVNCPEIKGEMINLSIGWMSNEIQTLKNQYSWQVFDQWIVSDYFLESNNCFKLEEFKIFDPDFLLEQDSKFGGVKPKRTYVGFKYQEGFSDHLPVLLRIKLLNH